ncbi:MAG: hypothetical protein KC516_01580 [Nanoarchaeota archaeon]|nr:hypothetical protein [Nanoarchaeota archaeon]
MKNLKQKFVEEMSPEEIDILEHNMRPGRFSEAGFLGESDGLKNIVSADSRVLKKYGITYKQIADKLDSLTGQSFTAQYFESRKKDGNYRKIKDGGFLIENKFKVHSVGWMGSQYCPFYFKVEDLGNGGKRIYNCGSGSYDFTIKNVNQGTEIKFPQLMSHLIRDHHFFEGETSYRLDPEKAIKVLELIEGVDYTPKTIKEIVWDTGSHTGDLKSNFCRSQDILKNSKQKYQIAPGVTLHVSKSEGVVIANEDFQLQEPFEFAGRKLGFYEGKIWKGQTIINKKEYNLVVG